KGGAGQWGERTQPGLNLLPAPPGLRHNRTVDPRLDDFLSRCLLLDLETGPNGEIHKIGAIRGERTFIRQGRFDQRSALAELEAFASSAQLVLGHNLLGHDLYALRAREPALSLLKRRVVDTLFLSPLVFPENPYHRLVKDYKLVRDAVSDPVADCRLAGQVFREQWAELARRGAGPDRGLLSLYRFCFRGATDLESAATGGNGISLVFGALGAELPNVRGALDQLRRLWAGRACACVWQALAMRHFSEPRLRPAVAYVTAWLQVAGARSVLPPWVRHRFPETAELIRGLRDVPCGDPNCAWCAEVQDPRAQLRRWFGFDTFRPAPAAADGGSLQEAVVTHGLGGGSLLAILPTGGGKSLCFQLPALVRNLRRGTLTVVISPLQALMKDQVDNLTRKTGTTAAAALYGMLTPPERGEVLERVRLGDTAILYVSPEQLRNASFRAVLEAREIGCWVFDEAHCLSKWGHDFRPDYLYAGRFIQELAARQGVPVPPVACFTATAKRDVTAEILTYFREHLNLDLNLFEGGVERDNLAFEVQVARVMEKPARVHAILAEYLADCGAAVVYASTRQRTEELAAYLRDQDWPVEAFHAGLSAPEKRRIQDAFMAGEVRIICATNAFGMGVDKEDVRLVVHLDIPGSLENYVQEAGRAGRDRNPALCVLLYDEQDVERQFRMEALSELTRQDIAEILRGLRRAQCGPDDTVVLTSGELLRDEDLRLGFDSEDRQADTRIRVAVAWLERAGLVERNENRTRIFQGRPAVASLEEARRKIAPLGLSVAQRDRWISVLEALINADPDEGFTADELARLPAFKRAECAPGSWDTGETAGLRVLRTLHDMANAGLLHQGPQLSAFLRHKVKQSSEQILRRVCELERAMLEVLRQEAPDAETGEWQSLGLRRLNQRLLDEGLDSNPETLRNLLASLARDGRGLAGERGSLEFRQTDREHYRVKLHRDWLTLTATAERRQAVAGVILAALTAKLPPDGPAGAERLVSFGTDELTRALQADLTLAGSLRDPLAAADRGLMFLHEQGAIVLQRGLAVFRQAMTIRLLPQARARRYTKAQYQPLAQHYGERIFQIHVMNEYARLGAEKIRQALALITAYFTLDKANFVRRFFPDRREVLERATTADSFRRIVDALGNPAQVEIVAAPDEGNRLVLAGPGSGKTRVVVHRCAYLLRVRRVDPSGILVVCFNRNAALTLRRRLLDLVGEDAHGVTVQTYHGLAMRLTGCSFAERLEAAGDVGLDLDTLIPRACDLLEGRAEVPGIEPDLLRDRLLAGYRHILVDEYQDIDADQYRLISALAGRNREEAKLTLLAVGDDDQNVYAFRGANVGHIHRFREDYQAEVHYLVESYRSSGHIVAAANALIARNRDRMKTDRPIGVDARRRKDPAGGRWEVLDPLVRGRVLTLEVPDPGGQAAALVERIQTLRSLGGGGWSDFACLARTRAVLAPVRALCESAGIPVAWRVDLPPLHRIREVAQFLDRLKALGQEALTAEGLLRAMRGTRAEDQGPGVEGNSVETDSPVRLLDPVHARVSASGSPAPLGGKAWGEEQSVQGNPWEALIYDLIRVWADEAGEAAVSASQILEFCYETLAEQRRDRSLGDGVLLSTLHGAKGMEFPHVLIADGGWGAGLKTAVAGEDERRLFYVGMTRARETLTLGSVIGSGNPWLDEIEGDWLLRLAPQIEPPPLHVIARRYSLLTLADLDLGYAGRLQSDHPIHARLANLQTGDRLRVHADGDRVLLCDDEGFPVARLSKRGSAQWLPRLAQIDAVKVVALLRRHRTDGDQNYRDRARAERWEVPLVEIELCDRAAVPGAGPCDARAERSGVIDP
ncbi:MAG: ATP-dependent helicase, RecQ family, partial [Chromatiaceae bacterium]|nr:ATP-dependent helicase, RecQ family [Chromatiaceae bacterium]